MEISLDFIGWHGLMVMAFYAIGILVITVYFSYSKKLKDSLGGFYLGGKGLGALVLFFTLYASQYSGNTIVGYAPKAYRMGYAWFMSVPYMIMVIVGYLLFAPRLHVVSKRYNFVTPTDWLTKRFNSKAISLLASILMIYALGNYLLEQLIAMGHAVDGITGGFIPYYYGVLFLVAIMLLYEWLGGMKAVAIADTINGILLLFGVVGFIIMVTRYFGGLGQASTHMVENFPEKIGVPSMGINVTWISIYILVGIGAAVYPHAIQRIYAAESESTLKKSLRRMAWMPFITTGVVFIVGLIGIQAFPELGKMESEKLVGMMANTIASKSSFHYWFMMLFFAGIIGAIMSTADSVILALSSLISKDLYGKYINPDADEKKKVLWGKIIGIVIVFALLFIAWNPPGTLFEIFVLKFEVLIQVAPAFLLGLYWKKLTGKSVLVGMIVGAFVASLMTFTDISVGSWHGGTIGLAVNMAICVIGSLLFPESQEKQEEVEELLDITKLTV
ncbi:MAG: sodium:solute symporter family protein [Bacillota bacterium]